MVGRNNEKSLFSDHFPPCGGGGWVRYRVLSTRELDDLIELIKLKKPAERRIYSFTSPQRHEGLREGETGRKWKI